jgi:hypothetical protein
MDYIVRWGGPPRVRMCFLRGRLGWVYLKRAAHLNRILNKLFGPMGVILSLGTLSQAQRHAAHGTERVVWATLGATRAKGINPSNAIFYDGKESRLLTPRARPYLRTAASAKGCKALQSAVCSARLASGPVDCQHALSPRSFSILSAEIHSSTGSPVRRHAVIRDASPAKGK